jgi:YVTN family beta-propeller protein
MSPDRRTAYISNGQSSTVSVIDTDTLATVATIPVAPNPQEAAVTPDGGRLFLVHQLISDISVIDTATNQVIRTIRISGRANDILFTLTDVSPTLQPMTQESGRGHRHLSGKLDHHQPGPRRLAISPRATCGRGQLLDNPCRSSTQDATGHRDNSCRRKAERNCDHPSGDAIYRPTYMRRLYHNSCPDGKDTPAERNRGK